MKSKNKAGFTLIELLVVVLIIGILASVAIPQYFRVVERSRISGPNSIFGGVGSAQESYQVRMGAYTADFSKLDQTYTGNTGACSGATCIMGDFTYTLATTDTGYTITATRTAKEGGSLPQRYGAYSLIYTVPGNRVTVINGSNTDELMD